MWFGAFIGFVLFVATMSLVGAAAAAQRDDGPWMIICLLTSLALFVLAGMALA
jgi:hypothetical protein